MTQPLEDFPYAPDGWTTQYAVDTASRENLDLTENHWEVIRSIHLYCYQNDSNEMNVRELTDALDEKFHHLGGLKYLYQLLPGGPVAQGCRLAGLPAPAGSVDLGFGSVQ